MDSSELIEEYRLLRIEQNNGQSIYQDDEEWNRTSITTDYIISTLVESLKETSTDNLRFCIYYPSKAVGTNGYLLHTFDRDANIIKSYRTIQPLTDENKSNNLFAYVFGNSETWEFWKRPSESVIRIARDNPGTIVLYREVA